MLREPGFAREIGVEVDFVPYVFRLSRNPDKPKTW
jgi:hypothetical protein